MAVALQSHKAPDPAASEFAANAEKTFSVLQESQVSHSPFLGLSFFTTSFILRSMDQHSIQAGEVRKYNFPMCETEWVGLS